MIKGGSRVFGCEEIIYSVICEVINIVVKETTARKYSPRTL